MYTTFQKPLLYDYMNLQIYLSIFSYWNIRVVLCLQMNQLSKVTLSLPPKGNIFVLFSLIARKHILSLVMLLLPIFCFLQWVFRILQVLLAFFFLERFSAASLLHENACWSTKFSSDPSSQLQNPNYVKASPYHIQFFKNAQGEKHIYHGVSEKLNCLKCSS